MIHVDKILIFKIKFLFSKFLNLKSDEKENNKIILKQKIISIKYL